MVDNNYMALICPHCMCEDFKVMQEFNEHNQRSGFRFHCTKCETIIFATATHELNTRFPS